MLNVYCVVKDLTVIGKHHFCCLDTYHYIPLPGGEYLVCARPRKAHARMHLADTVAMMLPSLHSPQTLTSAQVAAVPAKWGLATTDTMRTGLQKIFAATGIHEFDPDV